MQIGTEISPGCSRIGVRGPGLIVRATGVSGFGGGG